jgi:Asp-tRNA(Asn)/Glu-tRNA(Gln) amidotransferase A subunit family amidase
MPVPPDALRHAPLYRVLHALARGETSSLAMTESCLAAIERDRGLNAWTRVDAAGALAAARESDARRAGGKPLGRLDGITVAVKDNFDVAGLPTGMGLPGLQLPASADAHVVRRLRGAGAVILGKTAMDEAAFGTVGRNPHGGDVRNPIHGDSCAGGSSAGSAAAVAAGHCTLALGSDTLGSIRIPAAFCGLVGHKPTFGELGCSGLMTALRRLDCPGLLARCVEDVALALPVLVGFDAGDPHSRQRRVALATPDWIPGQLRAGVVGDLAALGVEPLVTEAFSRALAVMAPVFGSAQPLALEIAPLEIAAIRRAALLLMEAEILAAHGPRLDHASPRLRGLLAFAQKKSAADYVAADRRLDAHRIRMRGLFAQFDVLLLPTVPSAPPAWGSEEPSNLADLTALASLAGCPALSLPLPGGLGVQLVGAPGSDLRLLELGEILAAVVE